MALRKCTRLWTKKDGTRVRVCDMSDSHIVHSLRMLRRMADAARETAIQLAATMDAMMTADIASSLAEQAFEDACETPIEEHLDSITRIWREALYGEASIQICGAYDMRTLKTEPSSLGLCMTRDAEPDVEAVLLMPSIQRWKPGEIRYWRDGKEITKKEALAQIEREEKRE